ncbi:uncharacterized protein LOC132193178 [Neocloeon triangulifer]|uniref:uncharacterized protein LOC132193178 n=1 Tax=Neocloeon triangulifer TaxID=2078957 RepID=UPI00286F683E|nr:uncharacterized protein LOC132193178 [Neocloeon triangulifer]
MLASSALPVLLVAAAVALHVGAAEEDPYEDDDYDEEDYPVEEAATIRSTTEEDWPTTFDLPTTQDPTEVNLLKVNATEGLEDADERGLHSLLGGENHEETKRAGSTQAKGAATITKAMHSKPVKAKERSRGHNRQTIDSDEATNSIWGYNPTTPIDPDEEDQHFKKVITPYNLVTRRPHFSAKESAEKIAHKGKQQELSADLKLQLQKLDFYFMQLMVLAEDCRRRLLCEVADHPADFQPLSFVLMEETSFKGDYESMRVALMSSTEGARLLSYLEATASGQDRSRGCSGFIYRCPTKAHDMLDMEALALWRDMVRWMSVQVVALRPAAT